MTRTLLAFALFGMAQQQPAVTPDGRLPDSKTQELLKLDHKKNLEDAAAMAKLADEVSEDLEKSEGFVMPLKTLKKLDEIERLTKAIRGRLKKY
jgi:hypothetical protein